MTLHRSSLAPMLLALLAILLVPRLASAAVTCDVQVIHATRGDPAKPAIDPALKGIEGYLKKSFGARYAAFRQLDRASLSLKEQQRGTVGLPDSRQLALTNRGLAGGFIRLFMELPGLKTTVKIRNGGLFFQAGYSYRGGIIILAIRARSK